MKKSHKRHLLRFDRALSNSLIKQIGILAGILLVSLLLSYLFLSLSGSDWKVFCKKTDLEPWLLPIYLLIDGNALNCLYMGGHVHGWMLIASSLTYLCGILIFNGMLIGVITNAIADRVDSYRNGLTHYLYSGHYIIMGFDDMVPSVIRHIFDKDKDAYVLLMSAVDANSIREKLRKTFSEEQAEHIIINYGLRTSKDFYADIHLEAAEEVFIVGLRSLPAHDAMNIECIDSICSYLKNDVKQGLKPKRITCVFEDLDTYASFKTTEIFKHVGDLDIEFVPYNFYSGWANQVLLTRHYMEKSRLDESFPYPSVYGDGITPDDNKFVHLVFVGITNLSAAFAVEAANMMHFPNFSEATKSPKTRITFIDTAVDQEKSEFITRNHHLFEVQSYLHLDLSTDSQEAATQELISESLSRQFSCHDFLDIEFEFIKGDIFSQKVQHEIRKWATSTDRYLSLFLTMSDQRKNFMMGMNMPDEVYDNEIPLFIRQTRADNFVTNLREADDKVFGYSRFDGEQLQSSQRRGRYANIYPFGMNDMAFSTDDTSINRAKLINFLYSTADYNDNHFMDMKELDAMTPESIWTRADEDWNKLTVALKWSNLYCVYNIPIKLASLRAMRGLQPNDSSHDTDLLSENEIKIMGRVEHNRWNVEKLLMGYRKANDAEDKYCYPDHAKSLKNNKKLYIHHDIRPYDDLDESTKQWDLEIVKYIPWILKITRE